MDKDLRLSVIFSAFDRMTGPIRGMGAASAKLTAGIRDTQKELRQLGKSQEAIKGFRDLKEQLVKTRAEMVKAGDHARKLGREIATTDQPTIKMRREFEAAKRASEQLRQKFEQQNTALGKSRSALAEAGIKTSDLARHQSELGRRTADASRRLGEQKAQLEKVAAAAAKAQRMRDLGGKLAIAGGTGSISAAPILAIGRASFMAASDVMEMGSAFEVTFGKASQHVDRWAAITGERLQRSRHRLKETAMAYQSILKQQMPAGQATALSLKLTEMTRDLASFKNLSDQVAQEKIFSGLIGEAEPLRAVGVLLSDNAVKAKALALGFSAVKGQFSEGAKVQARAALIMEQLRDANGDIVRTSESAANKLKATNDKWFDFKVKIGTDLLPKLTPLIDGVGRLLDMFGNLPPGMQTFLLWAALAAVVIGPLLIGIGALVASFGAVAAIGGIVAGVFGAISIPVLLFVAILAGLAIAIYVFWDQLKAAFWAAVAWMQAAWQNIVAGVQWLIQKLAGFIAWQMGWWQSLGAAIGAGVAWVAAKWEGLKQTFWNGVDAVKAAVSDLPGKLTAIGKQMMDGLLGAIDPMALGGKLVRMAENGITAFKNFLGIKSPSRVFMAMGGYLTEGLAVGIDRGGGRPLRAMGRMAAGVAGAGAIALAAPAMAGSRQPAAGAAARSAPVAQAGPITIHIHQQPGEDSQALAERVAAVLDRRQRFAHARSYAEDV